MKPIKTALRDLMREKGITDGIVLSGIAEVSAPTVSLYLSGKRGRVMNSQARGTVCKLATGLGVEPEYFLEYRMWKADQLVKWAMPLGLIDLEDVELVIERRRLLGEPQES